jgi:phenylacetate-CoA ligase
MKFDDNKLDFMEPHERDRLMGAWLLEQYEHATSEVEYIKRKYNNYSLKGMRSINDALQIPIMDKDDLRNGSNPYHLVPKSSKDSISYCYSTSGTTGKPADIFFTQNDWNATRDALVRCIRDIGTGRIVVFNSYRQDHISSMMFNEAFRSIGALIVQRKFGQTDKEALDDMKRMDVNVIIAPWNGQAKGGSINDYLILDASERKHYINGDNIKALFCSSIPQNNGMMEELNSLGINRIINNYGLTEAGPLASSCTKNSEMMHIVYGPHYIDVVDEQGNPAKNNMAGSVRLFTLRGYNNHEDGIRGGTQLFNYDTGDKAVIIREPCDCGRTSPRIHSIERVRFIREKLEAGCQVL